MSGHSSRFYTPKDLLEILQLKDLDTIYLMSSVETPRPPYSHH